MAGRWWGRPLRGSRGRSRRVACSTTVLFLAMALPAWATLRYGDIQISGNISAQNLFRIQDGSDTFSAFKPVQQRNTLRLQYEHQLINGGKMTAGLMDNVPLFSSASFFLYYRFAYDSIFDIAPGPFLESQDGASAGKIEDIRGRDRWDVASENVIREVFIDLDMKDLPVSFRIGRQQIVWGEALSFRALDATNPLDLTWHAQQEAGLFGKVGFDELRIPLWAFKMLVNLGTIGPFSNTFVEAYDIPFDFQPAEIRFLPAPWSIPLPSLIRGGLLVDLGTVALGTPTGLTVQPCFDMTGGARDPNTGEVLNNEEAAAAGHPIDYSDTAETGVCNSSGLQRTRFRQGLYDRRDPEDVNHFGIRLASVVGGVNFTIQYMHRRTSGADIPGSAAAKAQVGAVNSDAAGFVQPDILLGNPLGHETTDPITRETKTATVGYLRVPVEVYYPYVETFGLSANYFEEFTGAVLTAEAAFTHGLPISTLDPHGVGLNKKDVILGAINFDRPTWIRFLNPRATWLIIGQLNFNVILDHDKIRRIEDSATGQPQYTGDVSLPNSSLIPGQFGGEDRIDELKQVELLSILAATSFYRGGTIAPLIGWISDWANAPSMGFQLSVDYLPTNDIIITPALRIFTNFGRTVDEPWGIGRFSQWDEFQLKFTYQF